MCFTSNMFVFFGIWNAILGAIVLTISKILKLLETWSLHIVSVLKSLPSEYRGPLNDSDINTTSAFNLKKKIEKNFSNYKLNFIHNTIYISALWHAILILLGSIISYQYQASIFISSKCYYNICLKIILDKILLNNYLISYNHLVFTIYIVIDK